jgi:hypothetical protein
MTYIPSAMKTPGAQACFHERIKRKIQAGILANLLPGKLESII